MMRVPFLSPNPQISSIYPPVLIPCCSVKNYFSCCFKLNHSFMKQYIVTTLLVSGLFVIRLAAQAPTNGIKYNNGFTTIYKASYSSGTYSSLHGLKNEKTGAVVLPMEYREVSYNGLNKLFKVQTTSYKYGLFDAAAQKFILEPIYDGLEMYNNGIAVIRKDSAYSKLRYGAVDGAGNIVIPIVYTSLGAYNDGLLFFSKNNTGMGYLNAKNEVIIEPRYQYAGNFKNGLAPAQLKNDTLYGYINKKEEWVISPAFASAAAFQDGYATVAQKVWPNGRLQYGTVNTKGILVIPAIYDAISNRKSNGTFVFTKVGKYGIVDSLGKVLTEKTSVSYPNYVNDLMIVYGDSLSGIMNNKGEWVYQPEYKAINYSTNNYISLLKNKQHSVVDTKGKVILKPVNANRVILGKNKFMAIYSNRIDAYNYTGKLIKTIQHPDIDEKLTSLYLSEDSVKIGYKKFTALYDITGNAIQKLDISEAYSFSKEGIFAAKNNSTGYDYYDYTGKQLSTAKYYTVTNFSEGYAVVQLKYNDTARLIDKNFKEVKKSVLLNGYMGQFSEGLARIKKANGLEYGFVDTKGNEIFSIPAVDAGECTEGMIWIKKAYNDIIFVTREGVTINQESYEDVRPFSEGLACVKKAGKWAVINKKGEYVIQPYFDNMSSFSNGVAIGQFGTLYYLIDKKGKRINDQSYTQAGAPLNGYVQVKQGDNMGIIDLTGKVIIPISYKYVYIPHDGIAWAQKDLKLGALNLSNIAVSDFKYDNIGYFENGYGLVELNKKWGIINKTGKTVLPVEFEAMSTVFRNKVTATRPAGYTVYALH